MSYLQRLADVVERQVGPSVLTTLEARYNDFHYNEIPIQRTKIIWPTVDSTLRKSSLNEFRLSEIFVPTNRDVMIS